MSKNLLTNYLQAQNIINKTYQNHPYYNHLLLSCFVLLTKYPKYHTLIEDIMSSTEIIIENAPLQEILKDIILPEQLEEEKKLDDCFYPATSFSGISFIFDKEKHIIHLDQTNPLVAISTYLYDDTETIEALTHELNHIIKSIYNSHFIDNKEGYCQERNGLQIVTEYLDGRFFSENEYLDEVINVLQVQEMLKNIRLLKPLVNNKPLVNFLNTINFTRLESILSYENIAYLLENLWHLPTFKNIFEPHLITGNISLLKQQFNAYLNQDCFAAFSYSFDTLFYNPDNTECLELIKNIEDFFYYKENIPKKIYKK